MISGLLFSLQEICENLRFSPIPAIHALILVHFCINRRAHSVLAALWCCWPTLTRQARKKPVDPAGTVFCAI
jgi:hypothetical protein